MAWTAPKTWSVGETLTAANFNTHLRDNMLAGGPHLIVRKTSDESVTSSTVLQDDNQLILPVAANEVWQILIGLVYSGVQATGDIKIAFTFPASGDLALSTFGRDETGASVYRDWTGTTTPTAAKSLEGPGATVKRYSAIQGIYVNAGTAGSVTLQWAQQASNATATIVRTHSTLWAVKLA